MSSVSDCDASLTQLFSVSDCDASFDTVVVCVVSVIVTRR